MDAKKSLRLRYRKLHRKFELLHILFSSLDIHVFPRFLQAHSEGCKTAAYSEFDSALWLTGGYDGVIRSKFLEDEICIVIERAKNFESSSCLIVKPPLRPPI
jgi:hypothetical protein